MVVQYNTGIFDVAYCIKRYFFVNLLEHAKRVLSYLKKQNGLLFHQEISNSLKKNCP